MGILQQRLTHMYLTDLLSIYAFASDGEINDVRDRLTAPVTMSSHFADLVEGDDAFASLEGCEEVGGDDGCGSSASFGEDIAVGCRIRS